MLPHKLLMEEHGTPICMMSEKLSFVFCYGSISNHKHIGMCRGSIINASSIIDIKISNKGEFLLFGIPKSN